ncbi:hypothetical protein [Salinispora mooreana]|uniref:hypothetical protein n=1 Tax=Salinispora mooreana TaxID=999545 RepID=UPI00036871D6|nr:hypothetical protein [Salinispora mooreana]
MNRPHRPPGTTPTRSRRRWWAVGLAGVTGLALTTIGTPAATAADTAGHNLATANDRSPAGDHHDKNDKGKKGKRPPGTPVPCDTDALIAAITLANARGGATLNLASKCTYLLTADIDGAGLPAITTPITLNGHTHTTIERAAAADEFRILTVNTGGNLTLNKLKITGGQTTDNGGGILVDPGGTLTTNHSTITRNIADGAGGGIANNGTTTVKHSTVSRNTAGIPGGGIANNGTTTVKHSTVSRNTAGIPGGGIWNTGLLTVTKSDITANLSGASGGGIQSTNGTLLIDHSRINDNQSVTAGGGLEAFNVSGMISNTEITGNTGRAAGGANVSLGQLTFRKVLIANNRTTMGLAGGLNVNPDTVVTVEDSTIKNNTAVANGGGIFNFDLLVLRNTKVIGNQSGNQGGGIYNNFTGTLTLFNTQVIKNIATTDGGGIFNNAIGVVDLNPATGTVVVKNRPDNCVNVPECAG